MTRPPTLLVRRPSPRLAHGQLTHIADERSSVSFALAQQQWDSYVSAWRSKGWEVVEVEPEHSCPDSVFVEDTMVYFQLGGARSLLVLASPGHTTREPELEGAKKAAERLAAARDGQLEVVRIEKPGTLDGGDVLKIPRLKKVYVGRGTRTNQAAITQLGELLGPHGWSVQAVDVSKALHLKSAVTALPDGTVIGWEPIVDDPKVFHEFLAIPEEHGVAVVVLGEEEVIMSSDAPQTRQILEKRGIKVNAIDISEFEKLEGCVTCLSVRIR